MRKAALILAVAVGWGLAGWTQTATNEVKQANEVEKPSKPVTEKEEPAVKGPEPPRPSFKPKERIPVDQGVDFPADI